MDTQATTQANAEKLIGEVQTEMLVFDPIFVRASGSDTAKWHKVVHFGVYVYDAEGGGYGAIVNARTRCGKGIRIDEAEISRYEPLAGYCAACRDADQQDRANSR